MQRNTPIEDLDIPDQSLDVVLGLGRFLGFFPFVQVFTAQELADSLTHAGFELDYQWQPSKGKAVFIVAKKPA